MWCLQLRLRVQRDVRRPDAGGGRARRLAGRAGGCEAFQACEAEHACEGALLEDLGRLLGDVRASTRRDPARRAGRQQTTPF